MLQKADKQLMKLVNEIRLLNLIRDEGPISKVTLAIKSHLSKVAVLEILRRLIDADLVIEDRVGNSTPRGGKRPMLVKLKPSSQFVIGIAFRRTEATIALADIEATILASCKINYEVGSDPYFVLKTVFSQIDSLILKSGLSKTKLISIGISIPGLIDYKKGKLLFADTLRHWDEIPLAEMIRSRYKVPAILENDVNAITLGESILGAGKHNSNLVCIWIGEGIGSGIVIDNKLMHGVGGSAGEIGYFELDGAYILGRPLQYLYQDHKYFGDILSEVHLCDVIKKTLAGKQGKSPENISLAEILSGPWAEQPEVKKILQEYSYLLGYLCLKIIKLISPELLIISGTVVENSKYILRMLRRIIAEKARQIPFIKSSIVISQLKEEAGIRGAIAMALQVIFESRTARQVADIDEISY